MTTTGTPRRSAHPVHSEPTAHLFAVGQTVRLRGGYTLFTSRFGDIFRVTGRLPPSGNSLQYRIRNEREQYERVATEDSLEIFRADERGDGAALVGRTFDR